MRLRPKPTWLAALLGSRQGRAAAAGAAVLWAACITFLSHIPDPPSPGPEFPLKDKAAHLFLYAVFGALVAAAAAAPGRRPRSFVAIAVAAAALYGAVDEVHQSFIPGRAFEVTDIAADVLGGFLGATGLAAMLRDVREGILRHGPQENP